MNLVIHMMLYFLLQRILLNLKFEKLQSTVQSYNTLLHLNVLVLVLLDSLKEELSTILYTPLLLLNYYSDFATCECANINYNQREISNSVRPHMTSQGTSDEALAWHAVKVAYLLDA